MSERKLKDSLGNLASAVANLERAITIPRDRELVFEGTIHRFEVTIELMWKTLKRALEYEGLQPKSPRETLKEAFRIAGSIKKMFGSILSSTGTRHRTNILPKNCWRTITTTW